jgi:hypothetical protein
MLGRLLERSEQTLDRLDRIEQRLESGDRKFQDLERQICSRAACRRSDPVPGLEKAVKAAIPYLIALVVLLATGQAETALRVLQAVGK